MKERDDEWDNEDDDKRNNKREKREKRKREKQEKQRDAKERMKMIRGKMINKKTDDVYPSPSALMQPWLT